MGEGERTWERSTLLQESWVKAAGTATLFIIFEQSGNVMYAETVIYWELALVNNSPLSELTLQRFVLLQVFQQTN